eukprot:6988139-Prymnesium_polylepis.1
METTIKIRDAEPSQLVQLLRTLVSPNQLPRRVAFASRTSSTEESIATCVEQLSALDLRGMPLQMDARARADGCTALMYAVERQHIGLVRAMLAGGSERCAADVAGRTASLIAHGIGGALSQAFDPVILTRERSKGVAALVLDAGTGEIKLLAVMQLPEVVMHELATVKWDPVEDLFNALDAGDSSGCDALCAALVTGLQKLVCPGAVQQHASRSVFLRSMLGVTAWYRKLSRYQRERANKLLRCICERLETELASLKEHKDLNIQTTKVHLQVVPAGAEA